MNKYTLTFLDSNLEVLFCEGLENVQNQVMIWISGCIVLNVIANGLEDCLQSKHGKYTIYFTISAYYFLQLILLKKYIKFTKLAILISYISQMYALVFVIQNENENLFIQGQNIMCLSIMIIFIQEFKYAAISNLVLLTFRIVFNILQTQNTPYYGIFLMTVIQGSLMVLLYFKSQYERNYFLLGLQHKQWEKIIPSLTSKPMFIFTFDQEQMRFIPKQVIPLHFFENINRPLHYFLRQSKYLGNTLEIYLFAKTQDKSIKNVAQLEIEKIKVNYNNQTKLIKIIQVILDVTTFIITIEDEDENIGEIKQQLDQEKNKYKRINIKIVQSFDQILKNAFITKNWNVLVKMRLQYTQILLLNKRNFECIETFNITRMFLVIIKQFKSRNLQIKLLNKEELFIRSFYTHLTILLLELIKNLSEKEQLILINIEEKYKQIQITIIGHTKEPSIMIIKKIFSQLIESTIIKESSINVINLESIYLFYKEPIQRFELFDK